MSPLNLLLNDPWLNPYEEVIKKRHLQAKQKEQELSDIHGSLPEFANGHLFFGLHRTERGWVFREWAPNATAMYLIGVFSDWHEREEFQLRKTEHGVWEIVLATEQLMHEDLYRLSIHWPGGQGDRIPSYARRVVQDEKTLIFSAQVWNPPNPFVPKNKKPDLSGQPLLIYEAHIGMASENEQIASFEEFRRDVLPGIAVAGYNAIQLMAIMEHPYYGSFGYHVSNFFAVSSRFGTPSELKELIDEAHGLGIIVIMDIVHSHAVKNINEGLAEFDGTPWQYFHSGPRREHVAWDSLCFNYGKNEVLHFLLSNCKFWLDEYGFDGYRFDGITSMLYYDHGLERSFGSYDAYFDGQQDEDAIIYLTLANRLIHQVNPGAVTIAEDMSGMPGMASATEDGGIGFDYRLSMGVPDFWIRIIKEKSDEQWNTSEIFYELIKKRHDEKTVSYTESHDQALVGDKTIAFRLMDKEMYFCMAKNTPSLIIDRGIALHKIIRLITLVTAGGGYLNFMGNEFGHPEWIDFPRLGNNWSYFYARRQWSLIKNPELRYHFLSDFDREMISLVKSTPDLFQQPIYLIHSHEPDQVLVFIRGPFVFVFNFSPANSYSDYGVKIHPGRYRIVLNSDSEQFGGFQRIEDQLDYITQWDGKVDSPHYLRMYIPSRTALVFRLQPVRKVHNR
jgi:1,4-alpha-glucan branching enzyme